MEKEKYLDIVSGSDERIGNENLHHVLLVERIVALHQLISAASQSEREKCNPPG
jgi:hypothetical protein